MRGARKTEWLVFRAPLRSRDDAVPHGLTVRRAFEHSVCGFGERLEPRAPAEVAGAIERLGRRIDRFADAPTGSYVWTRDPEGNYWLGVISGPYRYDDSAEARASDLVHVRDCEWMQHPMPDRAVPAAVRHTFGRGGRNWQRINHEGVGPETETVWARHHSLRNLLGP